VDGLSSGKHVFVEKPLCLSLEELESIKVTYERSDRVLMVGFNRRFAPLIQTMKRLSKNIPELKSFVMTVNAGEVPSNHWSQDSDIGGGRLIGEACHFVDLLRYLADAPIQNSTVLKLDVDTNDTLTITLKFSNGSIGSIHYFSNGSKKFPKERLEIFSGSKILQLDNYRQLKSYDWPGLNKLKSYTQDKGQVACVNEFVRVVKDGGEPPIPADEIFEVARICIELESQ
jgi:predicted dehydrogenase